MTLMCFHCGFQTQDRADFLDTQGDGHKYWIIMICPQCSVVNPPVAETTYGVSPYKLPNVVLEETNQGIYVKVLGEKGGSSANPIHPRHHLLTRAYKGMTLREYDAMLKTRGAERSAAFKTECDALLGQKAKGALTVDAYTVEMDKARAANLVGPYDTRVEFRL